MHPMRRLAAIVSGLLMFGNVVTVAPAAAAPTTVEYPTGPGDCASPHTLQECIDSVDAGSTVVITHQIIENGMSSAAIDKSLTLRASNRSLQPELLSVGIVLTSGDEQVTVQDLKLNVGVRVIVSGGAGHEVTLRRLEVGKGVTYSRGIEVEASVRSTITVQDSFMRTDDSQDDALMLFAESPSGLVDFRVVGNRITGHNNPDSGAGVELYLDGPGQVRASVRSNVIWDVARCNCGAASGVAVLPRDAIQATVDVAGNTIERSRTYAIEQRNDLTAGGHLSLDVFDNIISNHDDGAFYLDRGAAGSVAFRAGYNGYYGNTVGSLDGFSRGTHNQSANPRFVDRAAGDLRLRADSPLIDKGQVCSPGGIASTDAAGRHRLAGRSVDLGAYERGAGSASGVVRLGTSGSEKLRGTSGRDILCGFGGDDTLCARGGGSDWVDGGSGRDKARTDSSDRRRSIEATASSSAC